MADACHMNIQTIHAVEKGVVIVRFKNKTVIVTGGANGIGKAVAESFAEQGAWTAVLDLDREKGEKMAEQAAESGEKLFFWQADVRHFDTVAEIFQQIVEKSGKIDILINNAGISSFDSLWDISEADWDKIMTTNAGSVLFHSRAAAKHMPPKSAIVNICSTRQSMSEAHTELYAASKGAVFSLTHALAVTLGSRGIRVNSISPGWIETGDDSKLRPEDHSQHPAGRVGKPADIAKACLYLSDPDNDFMTGENLVIDGGMTKKMIYVH